MASSPVLGSSNVMKAGFYNQNSGLQQAAFQPSLQLLRQAAMDAPLPSQSAFQILDCGCSQGRNSVEPVKQVLHTLSSRAYGPLDVVVTHEDLASNDFNSLIATLSDPATSYADINAEGPEAQEKLANLNIYSSFVGKSFYDRIRPDRSVHVAFAFTCLHWIQYKPAKPKDTFLSWRTKDSAVKQAFESVFEQGLNRFLQLRAAELHPEGSLVFHFPCFPTSTDIPACLKALEDTAQNMVAEGKITAGDLGEMCICDYLAPPEVVRKVLTSVSDLWEVASFEMLPVSHPAYKDYQEGRLTAAELAKVYTNIWLAVYENSFITGLKQRVSEEEARVLVDELFDRTVSTVSEKAQQFDQLYVYGRLVRK